MKQKDNNRLIRLAVTPLLPMVLFGCSDELHIFRHDDGASGLRLELQATIDQTSDTRADESGFADGDRFGLFVVNYSEGNPGTLTLSDNQVNNVAMTYNSNANSWQAATEIYWRDPITPADVYGYYPFYNGMSDVEAYSFEVRADQSIAGVEGDMGSYEASDFLWAMTPKAAPGKKVELTFGHVMAGVKVVLEQGSGFDGDAWTKLEKTVTVDNTVRTSEVNLSTGVVTPTGSYDRNIVMNPEGDTWRAVVVPQTIVAGKSVIGITIDGKPYAYTRSDGMKYVAGKLHTFTIKIDRKDDGGDYALTLVNEDITPWEADKSSHDFESNSYLTVHVAEAGTLMDCLEAMHMDAGSIRNLKITGQLSRDDIGYINQNMSSLTALNMKDVKLINILDRYGDGDDIHEVIEEGILPYGAFTSLYSLRRIILPETLKEIDAYCFAGLTFSSTIAIPKDVTVIRACAFFRTNGSFTIELPDNLEIIEDNAFEACQANMELKLPKTLKYIGFRAFMDARNVYGTFSLPTALEYIGEEAFGSCGRDLEGEIAIPEKITEINVSTFRDIGFKKAVKLTLHDGITKIGSGAFSGLKFSSPIIFPKNLTVIGNAAFVDCHFSGDISLPASLTSIGKEAFSNTNISGTMEVSQALDVFGGSDNSFWINYCGPFSRTNIERLIIGDNIEAITANACIQCDFLRYVSIGKNVSFIGENAFAECRGIETVVCQAKEPPSLDKSAFRDVDLSHCVLEVPESSIDAYRKASGWNIFQSITPHYELNLSLSEFSCLNKGISRNLIVRTLEKWEVAECPDWIHVSLDKADHKEEISVTVDALDFGSGDREGQIVFRLPDNGYATYLKVKQYDYPEKEDEEIVLQAATGKGTPIPVFIVGEGYGAESIVNGDYMQRVRETTEHLFAIEPFKTYRNMFSVSTAVALSPDNGAQDLLTSKNTKFGFYFPEIDCPYVSDLTANLKSYVKNVAAGINDNNIDKALIIMLSNYDAFDGSSYRCADDNCTVACIGFADEAYPYDYRGLVQHVVGGAAFGGLASEQIHHYEFIKGCSCPGCNGMTTYLTMKEKGLFDNVTVSGKTETAPWKDFIFHPKYSALVDMYEGGYNHLRGVWRSEPESVMSNYIPYYNTISRYAIYKQIMKRAGLTPTLDDFIENDIIEIPD